MTAFPGHIGARCCGGFKAARAAGEIPAITTLRTARLRPTGGAC